MAEERTIQSALDVDKLRDIPKVDSYFDKIYQRTYSERWSAYVSGLLMGAAVGAVLGAVAVFIPPLIGVGAIPGLAVIGQGMALFAGLGSVVGTTIGTSVGNAAGAVSAGFEEYERREKLEKIRAVNPELAEAIEKAAVAEAEAAQPKTRWEQLTHFVKRAVSWKLVAVGAGAGMGLAALFSLNPLTGFAAQEALNIFPAAGMASRVLTAAGIGGLVGGAFMGFMGGMFTNVVTNATRPLVSGKIFESHEKTREKDLSPQIAEQPSIAAPEQQNASAKFASGRDGNVTFCKIVVENRQLAQDEQGINL